MSKCRLVIKDEVNVRFEGLDITTRRKLSNEVTYFLPGARFMPAFKLGRWDGKVRLCDIGGRTYLYLLDKLLPIVENAGYEITLVDERESIDLNFPKIEEDSFKHVTWPKGHEREGEPIILRDYQVECINEFLANPQCVQRISTGAGKTLITAAMSRLCEDYGRTIVIVPTKDLVTQTEADYKNIGLDVGVYYGDRKEADHEHVICTWQSIDSLMKRSKGPKEEGKTHIDDLTNNVAAIICDECHKAKGNVLKKMLSGPFAHIPIRWGLTGTIPKEKWNADIIFSCIGPLVKEVKAKQLQDKGVLSNLNIDVIQTKDIEGGSTSYQDEQEWLLTDQYRLKFLAEHIQERAENGNTLVLVDRIKTGKKLEKLIPDSVFLSGSSDKEDREGHYKSIQDENNKVIIASFGIASTGINIPRIFNLYLIEPGKSFVKVIQSIGRGIRKAKDKDFVQIYDVCSTCKYSKRHLTQRKKFYKEEDFPFKVTKVDYMSDMIK